METYLLDTNIISYWMRGDTKIIAQLKAHSPADMFMSSVTLAEIYYGIEKSPVKKKERQTKIDLICSQLDLLIFDKAAAIEYAKIRAYLERKGSIISERDVQIASIAKANKKSIITHNIREFNRVPDLRVYAWEPSETQKRT